MILMTLDLATSLGWSRGDIADPHFQFGTHRLPSTGEDIGRFAVVFDSWLHDAAEGVDQVVFESPILPKQTSLVTVRKLSGLAWHVEFFCKVNGLRCEEVSYSSVKKFVAGHGFAKKPEMIAAVRRYGYDVQTDDEADAVGARLYTVAMQRPDLMGALRLDMGQLGTARIWAAL